MSKIIDTIIGDLNEKKEFRENEKRAKALPQEYAEAYKEKRNYLWATSGITTISPLVSLVDLLEEAAANKRSVTDVTGPDVAAFADELTKDEQTWKDGLRDKLNKKLADS